MILINQKSAQDFDKEFETTWNDNSNFKNF